MDTCLSGREAIERCASTNYDIVFLDHMMPGFDGVETLKQIRSLDNGKYKKLPIIALTANTISGAREMFRSEGFTEFIPKPIERPVLERVLRRVLPKDKIRYSGDSEVQPLSEEQGENPAIAPVWEREEEDMPAETAAESAGPAESSLLPYGDLERAGFDVKMGLDYCAGDEGFYLEMLQMFRDQGTEKREEIVSLYEAGNWADYAVKVHALKSTSLTIGAQELSDHAKALEQAGKKGESEFIWENHAQLVRMHEKVCEALAGL